MIVPRLLFIDWMKCVGLALIVFGHIAGATTFNRLLPPIYVKQLGVAFFLFATGASLAREARPAFEVLYRRLFEVYLFGLAAALLMSATLAARGSGVAASNYLPFLLGVNVASGNFPANPSTWYIGTYIHFLLLWAALLRHIPIGPGAVALAAAAEVALRAVLWRTAGPFVAYMAFPNWAAVFLLGLACGQREELRLRGQSTLIAPALGAVAVAWILVARQWEIERSFPFMRLQTGMPLADRVATSAAITLVYLLFTALAYEVTRRLPPPAAVRFCARNSLLVFIAHMPVFAVIRDPVSRLRWGFAPAALIRFFVCFVLLAAFSELVRTMIRPTHWRDEIWRYATRQSPHPQARTSSPT